MRIRALVIAPLFLLAGCAGVSFGSHNVELRVHKKLPAAGVKVLHVENISGSIEIDGWRKPQVDVSALEYGSDHDAIGRTHVRIDRNGDTVSAVTDYDSSGGFFGNHNGAQVDYVIHAPSSVTVSLTNVSGATRLQALSGNINATEVSGRIDAALGRVGGGHNINLSAISGQIALRVRRNSDARFDGSSTSGGVSFFFPADIHRGVVGSSVSGTLGKGAASVTLHTISGGINVEPQ